MGLHCFGHDSLDVGEFFGGVGFEAECEVGAGVGGADGGPGEGVEFDADSVDCDAVVECGEVFNKGRHYFKLPVIRAVGLEFRCGVCSRQVVELL